MPEQSEPELYVVTEVWPDGFRVTVTDPKPQADAERFARDEAAYFACPLEVAPATQADLDESGEGA